jgi:hypothetical protein
MSKLEALKNTTTLYDLADLLGYRPKSLAYILYRIPNELKYNEFKISKKNGEKRTISEPTDRLKLLQSRLASILTDCHNEVIGNNSIKKSLSHGFRPNHSIKTNASKHTKKRYVFNVDLDDFFGTINFGRVRGYFIKDNNFSLEPTVATIIAQIACFNNKLPQGSPSSPIISNLIGHILDIRILYLAKKFGLTYSRYADDLTFSTNLADFPSEIATLKDNEKDTWDIGSTLNKTITRCGFKVNQSKTSMQYQENRQMVTGLVVNKKVNIKSDYHRRLRAMCHSQFNKGFFFTENLEDSYKENSGLNKLSGMLNHIYEIRSYVNTSGNLTHYQDIKNLYTKFIMYRHFCCNHKPLIICEGKTDYIYLKSSIKSLCTNYPRLISTTDSKNNFLISFFKSSKRFHQITDLPTGSTFLTKLMDEFKKSRKKINHTFHNEPIIVILDDDEGANGIIKKLKIKDKTKQFHHFYENMYIVLVPTILNNKKSDMEDCFSEKTLNITVSGRKFNRSNGKNTKVSYSKAVFAQEVVLKKQKQIDFSGFTPLLNRIQSTIDHHYQNK